jgi:ribosomal protein L7/L12
MGNYSKDAVDKAIKQSREPISKREAKLIHALLRGHQGNARVKK